MTLFSQQEMKALDSQMLHVVSSTISFWIENRINGVSASMADDGGNISNTLLNELDKQIKPLIQAAGE